MNKTFACALSALFASAVLVACGSDGDTPVANTPPTEVPASATASTTAFVTFTGSLAPTETGLPLSLTSVMPPTSETEAPQPVH
jgi:hypothetical protein